MLYFRIDDSGHVVQCVSTGAEVRAIHAASPDGAQWARQPGRAGLGAGWFNRNDLATYAQACELASNASLHLGQGLFIGIDSGPNVSPRFDIIKAPAVGDDVSKAFNGDAYPVGKITRISASTDFRVISVDGPRGSLRFYRQGQSARWVQAGGTWALIPGTVDERNPHF